MSTSKKLTSLEEPNSKFVENVKLVGDAWTLIIVEVLADGPLRFSEIERKACGICPVTLTDRLKKLEQAQVVLRHTEAGEKPLVVYSLTAKGRDILPIILELEKFAQKHHSTQV